MRLAILLGFTAITLCASGPDLPQKAPAEWAARVNPMAGNPRAQKAGAKLYERECSACHGPSAEGMGKAPSLRQAAVSQAPPGALFWILENGALFHGMPSFAHLPPPERWQIVTFLESVSSRKDQN
jgi:mono/diheme cytochrome c family protein